MPDIYYHCHNCGSIHEAEAIRLNLHLAGNPLGDAWFPRRSLLGWLEHLRVTMLVMRGLWRADAPATPITGAQAARSAVGPPGTAYSGQYEPSIIRWPRSS